MTTLNMIMTLQDGLAKNVLFVQSHIEAVRLAIGIYKVYAQSGTLAENISLKEKTNADPNASLMYEMFDNGFKITIYTPKENISSNHTIKKAECCFEYNVN